MAALWSYPGAISAVLSPSTKMARTHKVSWTASVRLNPVAVLDLQSYFTVSSPSLISLNRRLSVASSASRFWCIKAYRYIVFTAFYFRSTPEMVFLPPSWSHPCKYKFPRLCWPQFCLSVPFLNSAPIILMLFTSAVTITISMGDIAGNPVQCLNLSIMDYRITELFRSYAGLDLQSDFLLTRNTLTSSTSWFTLWLNRPREALLRFNIVCTVPACADFNLP